MPESGLDRFDRALLTLVQKNNLTPARVLAERIGLSESAVLRRLRRLRREGTIYADVALVRPEMLGTPLTVVVLIMLEREGLGRVDEFTRLLRSREEVVSSWYVTGEADFVAVLRLADMTHYEHFTRDVFLENSNVRSFKTMAAMREVIGAGDR